MTAPETALFPEPEHTERPADGLWTIGPAPRRWRYTFLGDDSEWLLFYGTVPRDELSDAVAGVGVDPDAVWIEQARWTYATTHDMCPHHLTWSDDCGYCSLLREIGGPIVTATGRGEPDDLERNTPGWFPVTVVDLEA